MVNPAPPGEVCSGGVVVHHRWLCSHIISCTCAGWWADALILCIQERSQHRALWWSCADGEGQRWSCASTHTCCWRNWWIRFRFIMRHMELTAAVELRKSIRAKCPRESSYWKRGCSRQEDGGRVPGAVGSGQAWDPVAGLNVDTFIKRKVTKIKNKKWPWQKIGGKNLTKQSQKQQKVCRKPEWSTTDRRWSLDKGMAAGPVCRAEQLLKRLKKKKKHKYKLTGAHKRPASRGRQTPQHLIKVPRFQLILTFDTKPST